MTPYMASLSHNVLIKLNLAHKELKTQEENKKGLILQLWLCEPIKKTAFNVSNKAVRMTTLQFQ